MNAVLIIFGRQLGRKGKAEKDHGNRQDALHEDSIEEV